MILQNKLPSHEFARYQTVIRFTVRVQDTSQNLFPYLDTFESPHIYDPLGYVRTRQCLCLNNAINSLLSIVNL